MKVHPSKIALLSTVAALVLNVAPAGAQAPASAAAPSPAAAAAPGAVPESETADVTIMPAATPRWVFVTGGSGLQGTRIFDGESGKMQGMIHTSARANVALDPLGRYYYVAESIWTKENRGTRQDLLTIYDSRTLLPVSEISLPGRLIVGNRKQNFVVSNDGKLGFIYNMQPSSSVVVVDLERRKYKQTVELPGCASLFVNAVGGVSALCSDGSLGTISFASGKASVSRTAPFFSASQDPIFDNGVVDRRTGAATFLTYTGLIYTAALGPEPKVDAPWSIQAAAGLRPGTTGPLDVNWIPGGRQPLAVHRPTGRIYVLMHIGEFWSSKQAAQEVWVLDGATHKLIGRYEAPAKVVNLEVSQDANPLVFVSGGEGKTWILAGDTFKEKYALERSGGGNLYVVEPAS